MESPERRMRLVLLRRAVGWPGGGALPSNLTSMNALQLKGCLLWLITLTCGSWDDVAG